MIGWAILDYAKMVMLRFHYQVMKKCFHCPRPLMSDTDSIYYLIESAEDPVDIMRRLNLENGEFAVFDLSEFSRYEDCQNKKVLGTVKVEYGDNIVEKFAGLCAKVYACLQLSCEMKKFKGMPKGVVEREITFAMFKRALLIAQNEKELIKSEKITFYSFISRDHEVRHCQVTKNSLDADDDKTYRVSPWETRPHGHYKNYVPDADGNYADDAVPDPPCPEWDLDDSDEELTVMLVEELRRVEDAPDPDVIALEPPGESDDEIDAALEALEGADYE
jgi:hypothetical protein